MKKIIALILSVMMLLSLASIVSFAEGEITADGMCSIQMTFTGESVQGGTYVASRGVKTELSGDVLKYVYEDEYDPMISLYFNEEIDTEKYPYVVMKVKENTLTEGTEAVAYYNELGGSAVGGQSVSCVWEQSSDWQWLVFDYTEAICDIGYIRYDQRGAGVNGGEGYLAGVFAFSSLEKFEAWKTSSVATNLGSNVGDKEITVREKPSLEYFYEEGTDGTGWWNNGPYKDAFWSANFEATTWFKGIRIHMYASVKNAAIATFSLLNDDEDVLWQEELTFSGDGHYDIYFDDEDGNEQAFKPDWYYLQVEIVLDEDVDDEVYEETYMVIGSGEYPESLDYDLEDGYVLVEYDGFATNGDTKACPAFAFITAEAQEETEDTEKKEDTEAEETEETEAPAEETEAPVEETEAPAEETEAPAEETAAAESAATEEKSGCGSVTFGFMPVVLLAGAALVAKRKE